MIINSLLFARRKHQGQTRIGGEPYINHPIAVAGLLETAGFTDKKYIITALFHDLLEDTDATEEGITFYGGEEVLTAVKLLTKEKGYNKDAYIEGIRSNTLATMVKLADRLHNLICAEVANVAFRTRYIRETEAYYLDLAKGTPFEYEINRALGLLKETIEEETRGAR